MAHKLIVLSLDALQEDDLPTLSRLPYFSELLGPAAVVRGVREIYPTLTYPIHTTIVTGVHPDRHGIPHNQRASASPEVPDFSIMGSDWYWEKKHIRVPTLADAVWERGGTAASVLWPVTAGDMRGYNLPEIWPVAALHDDAGSVYRRAASPAVMEDYYDRFIAHYDWTNNEDMVRYGVEIALDILRREKPDLFLCHLVHMDHIRHVYGDHGPMADACLRELDVIVGRFLQTVRDAGLAGDTNFVILGDHGQIDVRAVFSLNTALRERGLLSADAGGRPAACDAYSFSAGFSAQIMLRDGGGEALRERVHAALLSIRREYPQYIERVFTAAQVGAEERLTGGFSFVVEGTEGTLFANDPSAPPVTLPGAPGFRAHRAMHGHHPDKGPKPPFLAFGPDVRPGLRIDRGDMLDICPTLARLAGVQMPDMEGKPFPIFRAD